MTLIMLNSCESVETDRPEQSRDQPVMMPEKLSDNERRLIPYVEDVLRRAGFRPVYGGGAEYELKFTVDDGPVNADVHLTLLRRGGELIKSYARTGGPSIVFRRQEMISESFDKCLRDFDRQLPRRDEWRERTNYSSSSGNYRHAY
ncbi:hypothetical protein BH11VER1_BH11VER1_05240 [soil metagenome]